MQYLLNGSNWDFTDPQSVPNLLVNHLVITVLAMLVGLAIALPISFLLARYTRFYPTAITTASIIYTLPSLAFMAFLIPFTQLSPLTVFIPLVLYTQVVLIRNTVAAIRSIDPTLVEVGRAMGMNNVQVQLRVVLPLAAPIIIAGIRVTTVTTIGIAAIGPLFGTQNLGFLITDGLALSYNDMILAGAIMLTILAIGTDLLLLGVQNRINRGGVAVIAAS
ncbi:MAG: ABC transporter permease [Ktedonobacterales bacterium]